MTRSVLACVVATTWAAAACSGDDAHHQQTIPTKPDPAPAVAAGSAGSSVAAAPLGSDGVAPLSEDMATPFFGPGTDSDAGLGASRFALEDWRGAADALARALTGATGA